MKAKTTRAPQRARTAKKISAARAMEIIGDDPETLLLAIQLMDRLEWRSRRRKGTRKDSY